MNYKIITATILTLLSIVYTAHAEAFEMADTLRSNGKIYVVVGVILTIFLGIIAFLIKIDNSVSKIEKTLSEKENSK